VTTSTFDGSELTVTGTGTMAGVTVAWFNAADTLHASTAKVTSTGTAFASGDSVSIAAATYKDAANNDNTASSGTAINDTTAPSATLAKLVTVATAQASKTTTAGAGLGTVTVTAKKGGVADGMVGNSWKLAVANAEAAPSVSVNSSTKTITISADLDGSTAGQPTASSVSNALNADSTFSANFVATVAAVGNFDTTMSATNLTSGANSTTITVTFNEAIDPSTAIAANFGLDVDGNGTSDVSVTSTDTSGAQNGVIVLSITQTGDATQFPVAGTSKVTITTGVKDLAQNANAAQTTQTLSS